VANRARLIAAASLMMREQGGDLPLEAIAERAGTTRGTVYRNFTDRGELYLAVLESDLAQITARLALRPDGDLMAVIHELSEMMLVYDRFLATLPNLGDITDYHGCQQRIFVLIDAPLQQAQKEGHVRGDLTSADILVACRMVAADWRLDGAPNQRDALNRRLDIVLRGLNARS
jgi:AcrR family transcriptional regulator